MGKNGYNYDDAFIARETNRIAVVGFALSLVGLVVPGLVLSIMGSKKKTNQNIAVTGIILAVFWLLVQIALVSAYFIWGFDPFGFFAFFR